MHGLTPLEHPLGRVAKPVGFFSFYSRFTPKKYVTAVFFCRQNLSLLQFLKAVTSFTIRLSDGPELWLLSTLRPCGQRVSGA